MTWTPVRLDAQTTNLGVEEAVVSFIRREVERISRAPLAVEPCSPGCTILRVQIVAAPVLMRVVIELEEPKRHLEVDIARDPGAWRSDLLPGLEGVLAGVGAPSLATTASAATAEAKRLVEPSLVPTLGAPPSTPPLDFVSKAPLPESRTSALGWWLMGAGVTAVAVATVFGIINLEARESEGRQLSSEERDAAENLAQVSGWTANILWGGGAAVVVAGLVALIAG